MTLVLEITPTLRVLNTAIVIPIRRSIRSCHMTKTEDGVNRFHAG